MKTWLPHLVITALLVALSYWATAIYDASLRNPRFLDGWILATAMLAQLLLHLTRKRLMPWPGTDTGQVTVHIYTGVFVAALFSSHTTNAQPDTAFEWALWILFMLVVVSGIIGAYLTRAIPQRLEEYGERMVLESIPVARSELARRAAVVALQPNASAIQTLYADVLYDFFKAPRNAWLHLRRSRRPMKRMAFEVEAVEADLAPQSQPVLDEIKDLVEQKHRLDIQYAHEGVLKLWLAVHVPATYGLFVLSIVHVMAIYAYRSGVE